VLDAWPLRDEPPDRHERRRALLAEIISRETEGNSIMAAALSQLYGLAAARLNVAEAHDYLELVESAMVHKLA